MSFSSVQTFLVPKIKIALAIRRERQRDKLTFAFIFLRLKTLRLRGAAHMVATFDSVILIHQTQSRSEAANNIVFVDCKKEYRQYVIKKLTDEALKMSDDRLFRVL